MSHRADWLEAVLRAELEPHGYRVEVLPGAATRGRNFTKALRWITDHHDAMAATAPFGASLRLLMYGRPGLPGPLCQIADERDGTTWVVATGRANHAGYGRNPDGSNPNDTSVARESRNDGRGQPWPEAQRRAQVLGDAAILRHLGQPADHARGHLEVDPARKIDPTYPMPDHRARIAAHLGGAPQPPPKEWDEMATREEIRAEFLAALAADRTQRHPVRVVTGDGLASDADRRKGRVWYIESAGFTWGPMSERQAQRYADSHGLELSTLPQQVFDELVAKNADLARSASEPLESNLGDHAEPSARRSIFAWLKRQAGA